MMLIAAITGLGLVNTSAFNLTFGRSGFDSESPFDWFVWGARSLVAPIVYGLIMVAVVTGIVAVVRLVCRVIPSVGVAGLPVLQRVAAFARARKLDDPSLLLQLVTGIGALGARRARVGLLATDSWRLRCISTTRRRNGSPRFNRQTSTCTTAYSRLLE